MNLKSCATCKHQFAPPVANAAPECRRYPPQVVAPVIQGPKGPAVQLLALYPQTRPDMFCGEYVLQMAVQ